MTREEILLFIIIVVSVLVFVFLLCLPTHIKQTREKFNNCQDLRFILPTNKKVYTFTVDSELKSEEWAIILNAGWTFITCTTEQHKEYACFGDPGYNKTYWHYVFQKNTNQGYNSN